VDWYFEEAGLHPVMESEDVAKAIRRIGTVHAALEGAGLLTRAQKFVSQAYYLGSYDEVLRLAMEYVEVR
jgi:hypothetical protein